MTKAPAGRGEAPLLRIGAHVTLERLQVWLKEKQDRKAAQEEQAMEEAKKDYAKGKRPVMSGRALFAIDPSLFIDGEVRRVWFLGTGSGNFQPVDHAERAVQLEPSSARQCI